MFLDAGNDRQSAVVVYESESRTSVYRPWADWQPSMISHHGKICCEIAREWIIDTDFSSLNGSSPMNGPRWLRHKFEWGPGTYPIHWCELIKKTKLDCGVLAALAHEVFLARGVRSFRAQLVQEFSDAAAAQWEAAWRSDKAVTDWIRHGVIYHEGCAVMAGEKHIKLWDASAGWWVDPKTTSGYGSVRAIRVWASPEGNLKWGDHALSGGEWVEL